MTGTSFSPFAVHRRCPAHLCAAPGLVRKQMMQDLIRRADAWLKANRSDYYAILRPGVDDAALSAYEARFGLVLPAELKQLYRWRDGQDLKPSIALVHNHMFVPLSSSAGDKEMLD